MTIVVVAEKPSVARDIARVLGARRKAEGHVEGNGYVVTWALGRSSPNKSTQNQVQPPDCQYKTTL